MIKDFDIQIDDLPSDFRDIAATIGLEPALKLAQARGGEGIYVPKAEKICRAARDRAIRAAFNGRNHRELARKFGLTVVWIRAIVNETTGTPVGVDIVDKQMALF